MDKEELKRKANILLSKIKDRIEIKYDGNTYEILYHKAGFWWEEKFSIRKFISNLYTNHWEVNECVGGSRINCMGNGSGIIFGFFPKRKMKKKLYAVAKYWNNIK